MAAYQISLPLPLPLPLVFVSVSVSVSDTLCEDRPVCLIEIQTHCNGVERKANARVRTWRVSFRNERVTEGEFTACLAMSLSSSARPIKAGMSLPATRTSWSPTLRRKASLP